MKKEENLLKTTLELSAIFLSFHNENHEYNKQKAISDEQMDAPL